MNLTNITITLPESLNQSFIFSSNPNLPVECLTKKAGRYSLECLYEVICPQFNKYFIRVGLILIISYIIITWLLWWFMKYGYKRIGYVYFQDFEKRVYWEVWIRQRLSLAMLIYIVVVVWLSIGNL